MYENVYQKKKLYAERNKIEQLRLEHVNITNNEFAADVCNEKKKK